MFKKIKKIEQQVEKMKNRIATIENRINEIDIERYITKLSNKYNLELQIKTTASTNIPFLTKHYLEDGDNKIAQVSYLDVELAEYLKSVECIRDIEAYLYKKEFSCAKECEK